MVKSAIAFLLGCALILMVPPWPIPVWLLPACLCLAGLAAMGRIWLLVIFLLAVSWSGWQAQQQRDDWLAASLEGQDLTITGTISSLVNRDQQRLRFVFSPDNHNTPQKYPETLRLSWYYPPATTPRSGERWQFQVRLKKPLGMVNPAGFDYERWLFQNHIGATGYIRESSQNQRLNAAPLFAINPLRAHLLERIRQALAEHPQTPLVAGLSVGMRDWISTQQWEILRLTGTSHLLAISGLHIGLAALLGFWLVRILWSLNSRCLLLLDARRAGAVGAILLALFYALLAGLSIPSQRALIMVCVAMSLLLLRRHCLLRDALALALIAVLLVDPLAVLSAGFWLSFAAVAWIIYLTQGRYPSPRWRWAFIHVFIALGLTPLLLLFFGESSLVAPLANLVAVPVVSFLVVPLCLIAMALVLWWSAAADPLLTLAAWLLNKLWLWLDWLASLPVASLNLTDSPLILLIAAFLGIALLMAPRHLPAKHLSVVLILPLFLWQPDRPKANGFWLTILDVGQGLAAVVETQHHTLVFDTGPRFSDSFDTGEAAVVPYLQSQRTDNLDTLIISHGDNDHIGGAQSLLASYPAQRLLTSVPEELDGSNACEQGQGWQWDGVHFEILHPGEAVLPGRNDASCVLLIDDGENRALLTGDIEKPAEKALLAKSEMLNADIMTAPHHGSATSSTTRFIRAVSPQTIIIPAGYRNRYRFPAPEVTQRYRDVGSQVLVTGENGAVLFRPESDGQLQHQSLRFEHRYPWRADATE